MERQQRRNSLIAANAPKENPKFASASFDDSPLEKIDEEREREKEQKEAKAEEKKETAKQKEKTGKADKEAPQKQEKKTEAKAEDNGTAKKRGRKKKNPDEKCIVKTYNFTEEAVRFLEVYYMFHKEETPGMIISQAIIDYIKEKDPEVEKKVKILFN